MPTAGGIEPVTFGVQSVGSGDAVLVSVSPGTKIECFDRPSIEAGLHTGRSARAVGEVLRQDPNAPYTNFVGCRYMKLV
jgi:hypothetical protein